jgi:hypothetical protein
MIKLLLLPRLYMMPGVWVLNPVMIPSARKTEASRPIK